MGDNKGFWYVFDNLYKQLNYIYVSICGTLLYNKGSSNKCAVVLTIYQSYSLMWIWKIHILML